MSVSATTISSAAAASYISDKVALTIQNMQFSGNSLNPGEPFTFSVQAENASAQDGGLRLVDLVWRVWVETESSNGQLTRLYVPDAPLVSRYMLDSTVFPDPVGSTQTQMYIFPEGGGRNILDVGETNRLDLSGHATYDPTGGISKFNFELYGTLEHVQYQASSQARKVEILG